MKFEDVGYIINLHKHGENSLILTVVTKEHGKVTGFVKNCLSKKNLSTFQLGNYISINAYSRVDSNMLSLRVELISPTAVNFLTDAKKLYVLSSFCSLTNSCLVELMNIELLYMYVEIFFNEAHEDNWLTNYSFYEFYLLDFLGVGLDLSECAVTGSIEDLCYVSPKTGRAVCKDSGYEYRDRLFDYPKFIVENRFNPDIEEVISLLEMTEFFLNKNFFATHNLKFPINRDNLLKKLQ